MSERVPAERFDARDVCREEMAERRMGEAELPRAARWWLANPSVGMSALVAAELAETFGTSPRFWRNLGASS